MSQIAVSDSLVLGRLLSRLVWQRLVSLLQENGRFAFKPMSVSPSRLLIAPQDIRTADPTIAEDIYAGRFTFAGHAIDAAEQSPFDVRPVAYEWAVELHGFGWLRHLRAANTVVNQSNARALVQDWVRSSGKRRKSVAWQTDVVARRLLSWLSQTPLLLEDCDPAFYKLFLRSLGRQVRFLRNAINSLPEGVQRMTVYIALVAASVAIDGYRRYLKQSLRRLDHELELQILPDGGHVSRNPMALISILADLLPVRQAILSRGESPTQTMMTAVDRMMPMVRFFRHMDGTFSHFNGMGATPSDLVATILAYDDARGQPPGNAKHSGYQRIACGDTLVIMDTGAPPPPALSETAHAGCLSFELSSGLNKIIVNCGVSTAGRETWRQVARSTAAHSTLTLEDTSSCRFLPTGYLSRILGQPIISGPGHVLINREETDESVSLATSHDGYAAPYSLIHERSLTVSRYGDTIDGADRLTWSSSTGKTALQDKYAVRFHLHPRIKAVMAGNGRDVLLTCANGEEWVFQSKDAIVSVEESIYLSDVFGHRKSAQIVIYGRVAKLSEVHWSFSRRMEPAAEIDAET
ncbi:MAG: heparinase II/III family protein [Stappiaceae bacterium]